MFNLENPFRKKEPAKKDFFGVPEKPKTDADLAMEAALARAEEGVKKSKEEKDAKKLSPELQVIKDSIEKKIESGVIKIKEISIGGKDKEELEKELIKGGFKINIYAKIMMENNEFKISKKLESVDLVILSVADLGFPEGVSMRDRIYERAKEMGLEIAPAEVGPQLRLQYADQPMGESLLIGMEPITDSYGDPRLFIVERNRGGRRLDDYDGRPRHQWSSDFRFVFVRRK